MINDDEGDDVLQACVSTWLTKLKHAAADKKARFGDVAHQCQGFFDGPRDWNDVMGMPAGLAFAENVPDTLFKMCVNKVFEFVTIFGPALYYASPVRTANPRTPLPVLQDLLNNYEPYIAQAILQQEQLRQSGDLIRAEILEAYLNWLVRENELDEESRQAIDEALIKGRGCLWTELHTPPSGGYRVVASEYDSVDNLLVDPDAKSLDRATWIARKCVAPTWQVERELGLRQGSLPANANSVAMHDEWVASENHEYDHRQCRTNDLITYYKIWSKMGIGGRLSGIAPQFRNACEIFGDHVYLVVAQGVPWPLNLPPEVQREPVAGGDLSAILARTAWPTPFWANGSWPVTTLDFHKVANSPWPMSHVKAGLGELMFLNWAMSFLAGKIRTTCRDFVAIRKEAGEEIKRQITEGEDLTLIEIESQYGTISEIVQFLQHPPMNGDIWKVIEAVEANFDKRVGLTELMYGSQGATQIRSAQEAVVRNQNANVRPEDMAKQVEAWMSRVAQQEAACARYHLHKGDIAPALGPLVADGWDRYCATDDIVAAIHDLEYSIEAGSTRRPNKDAQIQRSNESATVVMPVLVEYAQLTGDVTPLNNLLADWAKSRDLDPERYQLRYAPVPANPQPSQDGPQQPGPTPNP